MRPIAEMQHHPIAEKLTEILRGSEQQAEPLFFRVLVAYYFAQMASMLHTTVETPDRGDIPVNLFAFNLAPSGFGKGRSTSIMEDQVINQFRDRFINETFPLLAERNLPKLALQRARRKQCDPEEELERVQAEFKNAGSFIFNFDSGTTPAAKQLRHKLLMANAGSINFVIDEIGSHFQNNRELLELFLELFDGKVRPKLVKNTSENIRSEEIHGRIPANLLAFGAPVKLLDGSKNEEDLYALLETGYARRCFFGYCRETKRNFDLTPEQIYDQMANSGTNQFLEELSDRLGNLADPINAHRRILLPKEVALDWISYRLSCEKQAAELPEHEVLRKTELEHRYFKVLKLAGAYAFIDETAEITLPQLEAAIKLAEESGEAFDRLLTRDRPYVKLAKYIAHTGREVTQADLVEDLPFYKGSLSQKQEMMTLAIAYGYQNNILIKKRFEDGIEFLRGETLKPTDLSRIKVAYSEHEAYDYHGVSGPFNELYKLVQEPGIHWINHHVKNGHRNEENAIPGFNLLVFDVDGGCSLETAKLLLKDYSALYYTTKRHTEEHNRFRILMPINYELELDAKDYKEFYKNLMEWLPFPVDEGCGQRSKKWLSHPGHYEYVEGELLDILPFIPKTSKNEERKERYAKLQSLDHLERWVLQNTGDGNRNNQLHRYARVLVDAGYGFEDIRRRVLDLNDKLADKLSEAEILNTVMVTVSRELAKRQS